MALDITRDELRADILEITITVVSQAMHEAIRENNHHLVKMINEDLVATNNRIDSLGHRLKKGFSDLNGRMDKLEGRMDNIEIRLDSMNEQLNDLDHHLTATNDKIDFTHKLLHVHIANPSAHASRG